MKKGILLGILIVIMAAILLTPWMVGRSFERQYLGLIEQLNRANKTGQLSFESYQRGWFGSTATLKLTERVPAYDANGVKLPISQPLILQQQISHGPLVKNKLTKAFTIAMAGITTELHLPDEMEAILFGNKKKDGLVTIYTIAHFNEVYQNQIKAPAISITMPPYGQLNWQGMNGESSFAMTGEKFSQFQLQVEIGELTLSSDTSNAALPPMMFNLQPISIKNAANRHESGLWTGRSEITFTGLTTKKNNEVQLAFDNLQLTSTGNVNANQLYDVSEKISLHKLQIPQTAIANITPANLLFSIENLNGKALMSATTFANAMPANPALQQQYMLLLSQLILPTTVVNGDVFINTSLGIFQLKGKLYWQADKPLATPGDLFNYAQFNLNVKIAAPLADQLLLLYAKNMEMKAVEESAKAGNEKEQNSDKDKFNVKVASLLQAGQVTLPASIDVMSLYDQHLAPADFTQKLTELGLVPPVSDELSQLYAQLYNRKMTAESSGSVLPAAANPEVVANAMRDQWVSQGYLVKEGTDYTFSITRENGVTRMNGAAAPATQPAQVQLPGDSR